MGCQYYVKIINLDYYIILKTEDIEGTLVNRPDKTYNKLSKTERELGGIPNTSEDVKQSHASAIESYIERYIGVRF